MKSAASSLLCSACSQSYSAIVPGGADKGNRRAREGSKYGIEEFLEVKYLCMGGVDR
jgi:hypothetical protein